MIKTLTAHSAEGLDKAYAEWFEQKSREYKNIFIDNTHLAVVSHPSSPSELLFLTFWYNCTVPRKKGEAS